MIEKDKKKQPEQKHVDGKLPETGSAAMAPRESGSGGNSDEQKRAMRESNLPQGRSDASLREAAHAHRSESSERDLFAKSQEQQSKQADVSKLKEK